MDNRLTSTKETRMRKADTPSNAAVSVAALMSALEDRIAIGECAAEMSFQYVHRI